MAHKINFNQNTGKHSLMSVKEKAWHGLGQIIERYPTSAEAIQFAGLDYIVEKRPNRHDLPGGKTIVSNNSFFTYRTDTEAILGDKIGADYQIVQNKDAFSFFDAIVGGGDGILYETAGALGNGERVFITAKLPEYITVGREDLIEQYLFLTTSHDGTGSIFAAFTPVRIVCNNTLNAAMNNYTNALKIRHTASAVDRLKQAHELMGISRKKASELDTLFNYWSQVRINDKEVRKLIQLAMVPNKETLEHLKNEREDLLSTAFRNSTERVFEYAMADPTQQLEITAGTIYGAYNAITGYYQNVRDYKSEEAKFTSIMEGTAKRRGQKAFDLCDAFARYGADVLILN